MKRFVEARRKKMRVVCRRLMEAPAPLKMIQDQRIVNRSDQRAWREICHLAVAVCSYTTHHWDITENPSSVLLLTTDSCQLEEDAHGLDWRVVSEIWHGVCLSPPSPLHTHTHTRRVYLLSQIQHHGNIVPGCTLSGESTLHILSTTKSNFKVPSSEQNSYLTVEWVN